jgi:hypothetical protein
MARRRARGTLRPDSLTTWFPWVSYRLASVTVVGIILSFSLAEAEDVQVPMADGMTTVANVHAEGVQIYECKIGADNQKSWQFREPLATLIEEGKTVGRHFAGPSWEFSDGASIKGKVVSQTPGATPADIPVLKLDVIDRHGDGVLAKVTKVQRLNTRGGVYAGSCNHAGALHLEPYSADYVFLTG